MKLTHQLILITALPIALIWGVGFYLMGSEEQSLRQGVMSDCQMQVEMVAEEVDRSLTSHLNNWQAYVQRGVVSQAIQASNAGVKDTPEYIQEAGRADQLWQESPEHSTLAREIGACALSRDLKAYSQSMEKVHGYPVFRLCRKTVCLSDG